ncbi:reticulon-like protein B18 [Silene latifolia]|uniref:reticulon-like protein B18 n=1 Tax=Silene latifolia TaxID=37657 RepID=UPI003D782C60
MEAATTIIRTPPSNKVKSASRLSHLLTNNPDMGSESDTHEIPHYQVEYAPSPRKTPPTSKLSITKTRGCLPMHELLLNLSPSPKAKSRTRLSDRLDMVDELGGDLRRRCKTRTSSNNGFSACGSPRNIRRSRRRIENEERDIVAFDELNKPKKRRNSAKSKKEKPDPLNSALPSKGNEEGESALDRLGFMIWDLVMWRDVAKSSLWFGLGCLCSLSSCFTKGLSFSLLSVISQLGLVFLAVSFMSNILHQREIVPKRQQVCLKEEDILKVIRIVLPVLNLAISKAAQLFSGEPSMTLKVASFFIFGAEYGHLLTLWRLCVLGFLTSFTAPKLYSSYAAQIDSKVDQYKSKMVEAWRACYHKKIVAASAATVFWNLSSLKTRVFAAFISLVILRYYRQHSDNRTEEDTIPRKEKSNVKGNLTVEEEQVNETAASKV